MTEAELLRVHTVCFNEALKRQDCPRSNTLSDTYMLVRPDGSVLTKQQVLKDLREQGLTFQSIDLRQEQIRLLGSVAILTGKSRTVSFRNGTKSRAHFWLLAVYAEEPTGIRLVHFQSTNLPD